MLDWLLAAFPILVILLLMVPLRWNAARAGPAGWLVAGLVATTRFGAGARLLWLAQLKAVLLAVDVLYIIWAAYLLYRVADEAGAIQALGRALSQLTVDRGLTALLIGWAFASFLQGVGGYGVPVAVAAPLMAGLGFPALAAVVLPSIGHAWSVTFGSLGASFQALMATSGLPYQALAAPAAIFLGVACAACGVMVAHAADGWSGVRRLAGFLLAMGLAMALVQFALAVAGLWNVAAVGAGLAGLAVGLGGAVRARRDRAGAAVARIDRREVGLALVGYVILVAVILAVQFVAPLRAWLAGPALRVEFPAVETARGYAVPAGPGRVIHPLSHAGALLAYAAIASFVVYRWQGRYAPGAALRILRGTGRGLMLSSLGVLAMVGLAATMADSGMTEALARGLAESVGRAYPVAAPWIGGLGAFMTGSNTNSNVVFTLLQRRTAELLGLSVPWVLAAQTAGGAVTSVIAPTKVIVGASTGGMAGREGQVLRGLAGYIAALLVGVSVLAWIFSR